MAAWCTSSRDQAEARVGAGEAGKDAAATSFEWEILLLCGDPEDPSTYYGGFDKSQVSEIAAPDNLAVDSLGQLWIATDGAPRVLPMNDVVVGLPVVGPERAAPGSCSPGSSARSSPVSTSTPPRRRWSFPCSTRGTWHRAGADQPVAEQPVGSGGEVLGGGHPAGLIWQGGRVSGLVVAAALLDGAGRVLAAQRCRPVELAGRWEFPGGKVEAGETEQDALVRECREELGVVVRPVEFVAEVPIPAGRRLRLWTASVVSGTPQPYEHSELRWVSAAELDALCWLEPDRPLLPPLRGLLMGSGS